MRAHLSTYVPRMRALHAFLWVHWLTGDMLASCSSDKTVRIWTCDPAPASGHASQLEVLSSLNPSAPSTIKECKNLNGSGQGASSGAPASCWRCSAVLEDAHSRTVRRCVYGVECKSRLVKLSMVNLCGTFWPSVRSMPVTWGSIVPCAAPVAPSLFCCVREQPLVPTSL